MQLAYLVNMCLFLIAPIFYILTLWCLYKSPEFPYRIYWILSSTVGVCYPVLHGIISIELLMNHDLDGLTVIHKLLLVEDYINSVHYLAGGFTSYITVYLIATYIRKQDKACRRSCISYENKK